MVAIMAGNERRKKNEQKVSKSSAPLLEATSTGLKVGRLFTESGVDPMSEKAGIVFENRNAVISDVNGNVLFEQPNVSVPKTWSMIATNIVASKYFRGKNGTKTRERSASELIMRVVNTITEWGDKDSYFASMESREAF